VRPAPTDAAAEGLPAQAPCAAALTAAAAPGLPAAKRSAGAAGGRGPALFPSVAEWSPYRVCLAPHCICAARAAAPQRRAPPGPHRRRAHQALALAAPAGRSVSACALCSRPGVKRWLQKERNGFTALHGAANAPVGGGWVGRAGVGGQERRVGTQGGAVRGRETRGERDTGGGGSACVGRKQGGQRGGGRAGAAVGAPRSRLRAPRCGRPRGVTRGASPAGRHRGVTSGSAGS
jgi:hypothetical protein